MRAEELLEELRAAGISVSVQGHVLLVRPADRLTEKHRAALRSVKPEVMSLLAASDGAERHGASVAIRREKRRVRLVEAEAMAHELIRTIAAQARRTTRLRTLGEGSGGN